MSRTESRASQAEYADRKRNILLPSGTRSSEKDECWARCSPRELSAIQFISGPLGRLLSECKW